MNRNICQLSRIYLSACGYKSQAMHALQTSLLLLSCKYVERYVQSIQLKRNLCNPGQRCLEDLQTNHEASVRAVFDSSSGLVG